MIAPKQAFLSVAAAFALFASLPAQREPGGAGTEITEEMARKRRAMQMSEEADTRGEKSGDDEWASLTPEQRLERSIRNGSGQYCRFVASCRPARLLPGQTGTLLVTALLQGQAVLPSPAPLEVLPRPQQGPVALGGLTIRPAEVGTLASGYQGRPVYDNYAVLEIPVTMGAGARLGDKLPVSVDLKFDLYDGKSAQAVGRFIERVSTEVVVGAALDPAVEGARASQDAAEPAAPIGRPEAPEASPGVGDRGTSDALGGASPLVVEPVSTAPAQVPPVESRDDGALPPPAAGGVDLPIPMLVGGGAFLLLIVVLLLRRR